MPFAIPLPIPTALAGPLINGQRYSYSSITLSIDGVELFGQDVLAINYKHGLKPESVYGTSPQKLGRTAGRYEADASLEVTKEVYGALIAKLSTDPRFGYMQKPFDISVAYEEVNQTSIFDTIIGCRIVEEENAHKSGPEGLAVRVSLDVIEVRPSGFSAIGGGVLGNILNNVLGQL